MIVTDPLARQAHVPQELIAENPDVLPAVKSEVAQQVIKAGEDAGCFIRRESVWFEESVDEMRMSVTVIAHWYPDPTTGVLFQGGPLDADVTGMRREKDGRPLARISRLNPMVPPYFDDEAQPGVTFHPAYERVGIDSERDMWVYKHVS